MKKSLFFLLAANLLLVFNSIGQTFYGSSDVISYSSGKVFSNTDKTVKIEIGYDGIKVNGNLAYFNLEINVLSTSVALIKGYSLSNPDGTISFRLNSSTGCIVQGGDSYCSSNSKTQSNTNNNYSTETNASLDLWKSMLPYTFSNQNNESLTLNANGTGLFKTNSGSTFGVNWTLNVVKSGTEELKITVKKVSDGTVIINDELKVISSTRAAIFQYVNNKWVDWN